MVHQQKVLRVGRALPQHFLECRNRLMPFGRTAETELGLHGAGLSFASIIGSIVLFCAMSFAVLTCPWGFRIVVWYSPPTGLARKS